MLCVPCSYHAFLGIDGNGDPVITNVPDQVNLLSFGLAFAFMGPL